MNNNAAAIQFYGFPGHKYAVQESASVNGPFSDVLAGEIATTPSGIAHANGIITAPSGGAFSGTVSPLADAQGFFQLRAAE